MSEGWTDAFLDRMRETGDGPADAVIADVFAHGEVGAVNALMTSLVRNDGLPPAELPAVVRDYLRATAPLPAYDREAVQIAEALFAQHGPEVLMSLGFLALPAAYAAKKGVQVLYRTAYLTKRPMRRVFETTQMVIDVLAPGGIGVDGQGIRTAQKVRLMHAAVRHLLQHDDRLPWDPSLGLPINQEDQAGTLMTFSYLVLEGLDRLGVMISDDMKEAYQHAWGVIGRVMGGEEAMIPGSVAEARALTTRIYHRQIAPSEEGVQLTAALLEGYETLIPLTILKGIPRALIHTFLDSDPILNRNIRELLGVGEANFTEAVILATEGVIHEAQKIFGVNVSPLCFATRRYGLALVEEMVNIERGGVRAPFQIPASLHATWRAQNVVP